MLLLILNALGPVFVNPAIAEKVQDGDFCNKLKVTGTGAFEVGVSVKDKELALEYYSTLNGDGDLEMDSNTAEAQRAYKFPGMGNDSTVPLNLWDSSKLTYSGKTPMVGTKYINSKAFWGGIGAEVKETFSVTEMERVGNSFFASTNPASYMTDPKKIAQMLAVSPVHEVGIETKNAFNGTWQTDARMHKMFSKDVKVHESFTGKFDVEKRLVFREKPKPEKRQVGCDGIDC